MNNDSDDQRNDFEDIYAVLQFTNFPAYQIEQLQILKHDEETKQKFNREIDLDGNYITTIGSERFYQFTKVLHPAVTEPILCAEHCLYEDLAKLKFLLNPKSIGIGQMRWLHRQVVEDLKEANGALSLGVHSEIRRYTFESACMLQFAIHYNQVGELITTKELFGAYNDSESHIHQAWRNIRDNEKDLQVLKALLVEVEEKNNDALEYLSSSTLNRT